MACASSTLLFCLFLLANIACSQSASNLQKTSNAPTVMNWGLPLAGHRLNVLPLQTGTAKNRLQCMSQCTKTKYCVSINLGPKVGEEHVCEMLGDDRYFMFQNVTIASDWTYVGAKSKCDKNPCTGKTICLPDYPNDMYNCIGPEDKNCQLLLEKGLVSSGRYPISQGDGYLPVYCDQTTDGGGWLVIQRNSGTLNFMKTWQEYKQGFGDMMVSFWWGNENIHQLTTSGSYELRIDLKSKGGVTGYAKYAQFHLSNEQDGYRLSFNSTSVTGDIGDSMSSDNPDRQLNGKQFTTTDRDHDTCNCNCATERTSGWWYERCGIGDLNAKQLEWRTWPAYGEMIHTEMKIRPM